MPTILIADDEASIVELVRVTLEDERIQVVEALDGETALALAETHRPDLVLLDVNLPDMSGLEVCAQLRRDPRLASMKIVMLTAAAQADDGTRGHAERVGAASRSVAVALGLPPHEAGIVGQAGLLHDIGKIGVPEAVLRKRGELDDTEWALMRKHPLIGAQIVSPFEFFAAGALTIRHHHERLDGSGYPDGLTGEAIPVGARIVAVADVYDALTSDRPYRAALPREAALEYLARQAGRTLDGRAWLSPRASVGRVARAVRSPRGARPRGRGPGPSGPRRRPARRVSRRTPPRVGLAHARCAPEGRSRRARPRGPGLRRRGERAGRGVLLPRRAVQPRPAPLVLRHGPSPRDGGIRGALSPRPAPPEERRVDRRRGVLPDAPERGELLALLVVGESRPRRRRRPRRYAHDTRAPAAGAVRDHSGGPAGAGGRDAARGCASLGARRAHRSPGRGRRRAGRARRRAGSGGGCRARGGRLRRRPRAHRWGSGVRARHG